MKIWIIATMVCLGFLPALAFQEMTLDEVERLMVDTAASMRAKVTESGGVSEAQKEQALDAMNLGVRAHQSGEYEEALRHYEKAQQSNPTDYRVYYEQAVTLFTLARIKEALQAAVRAQVLDPDSEHPYVLEANCLDNLGFVEKAIDVYHQLLERHPKSIMGYINLGVSYIRSGDNESGKQAWKKAIEIDPEHPSAYFQLANLAKHEGEEFEEEAYLKLFIEKGQNDRRLPMAEKRLEELNKEEIQVSADEPYMMIDMMVKMSRALWQKDKFLEVFPEKKGYEPSMEEELDVHTLILKLWKEEKAKDPDASHPFYDLLFKADEAGQFEQAVYALSQKKLPAAVAAYFQEDPARTEAFLAWGRQSGLVRTPDPEEEEKEEIPEESLIAALVVTQLEKSEVTYQMGLASPEASAAFKVRESKRYQEGLTLKGNDVVDAGKIAEILKNLQVLDLETLVLALSYVLPGDSEWDMLVRQLSRTNLRMRERLFPEVIPGGLGEETTHVQLPMDHPEWMAYWLAKAGFPNEPDLRTLKGMATESTGPTVEEEVFSFTSAVGGYFNRRDSEGFVENPFFEYLQSIQDGKVMEGFVLFEVIHRYYGIRLTTLTHQQRKAVYDYFVSYACEFINR